MIMFRVYIYLLVIIMATATSLFSQKTVVLSNFINVEERIERNEIFFKLTRGFDIEGKIIYAIESPTETIRKIDIETGRLIKTISRKGQGPGELMTPAKIRVSNGQIIIYDSQYVGFHIFSTEGTFIRSFKVKNNFSNWTYFDVDSKGNIYFNNLDPNSKTMVDVYSEQGKKLRSVIRNPKLDAKKDESIFDSYANWIKVDNHGNIFLVNAVLWEICKYTASGDLVWKNSFANEQLHRAKKNFPYEKIKNRIGPVVFVSDFGFLEKGRIVIAHVNGGCICDSQGNLKYLVALSEDMYPEYEHRCLGRIQCRGNQIFNLFGAEGFSFRIINIEEVIK